MDLQNPDVKIAVFVISAVADDVGMPAMPRRLVLGRQLAAGTARARVQVRSHLCCTNTLSPPQARALAHTCAASMALSVCHLCVGSGRVVSSFDAACSVQAYKLTERRYLGPTSMDHELAAIMCNLGRVRPRDLVFDPFAGTGSILIAAAAHGATVLGADIDVRVIRDGKIEKKSGQKVNVYSNFRDYALPDPAGLLRMDAGNPAWRPGVEGVLDAVLCDPPYGVRAGGRTMLPGPRKAVAPRDRCAI